VITPSCPQCGDDVRPPNLFTSDWRCEHHGAVHPLYVLPTASREGIERVSATARVPFWLPAPLLPNWTLTGVAYAGDDRTGARGTALACAGPAPLGGVADMVLVAEEPGTGLGSGYAGLNGTTPVPDTSGPPCAKVTAAGHPTALWSVPAPDDRAVMVGEARGMWLWAILWPAQAGYVLLEHVVLHDLRDGVPADLLVGAPSPYLSRRPPADPPGSPPTPGK
jgi:hypothetical protein